ncbi:MAG TPA: HNH endonuclease, partial [Chromatiaceae bacterium]|nr:HNH endonuclease [Chromatiaceae bacterium]
LDRLPVRITRSHKHKSPFSPTKGYQYAGVFFVEDFWKEKGKSGFYVWRFRLQSERRFPDEVKITKEKPKYTDTRRVRTSVQRIIRDTKIAKDVKKKHNYRCQVCELALETNAGLYAEAAHIKPLGMPHNGPDVEENILVLCPNHHVLFDNGGFSINDDLSLSGLNGRLNVVSKHQIDIVFLQYHREHYEK